MHLESMVNIKTEIVIHRPLKEVAEFASNPDNAPQWYQNIKSVSWKTPPPLAIGNEIAFSAIFMGSELAYTYKVVEMNDNRFVMQTSEGLFPMKTTYEWERVYENSTRMTLVNSGNPSGFSKLLSPIIGMMIKKENKKDLERLKAILEL